MANNTTLSRFDTLHKHYVTDVNKKQTGRKSYNCATGTPHVKGRISDDKYVNVLISAWPML